MKKLIPKDKQKLIYIQWQDAHHNANWLTPDQLQKEVDHEMLIIEQIGWIVYEDEKEIHLVARRNCWKLDDADTYGMYQRIPKAWILKRKVIIR